MEETNNLADDFFWFEYDDSDKPFDLIGTDTETALVCIGDDDIRTTISDQLKSRDFFVTEAKNAKEAVKKMHFNNYNLLAIDENFDTTNPDNNDLIRYCANLSMAARRCFFVVMVSQRFRTLDRMVALNRSMNMIINAQGIKDFATLVTNGMAENEGFYFTFTEVMKASGKI
ncbi:MAG: hypothetical protein JW902_01780 [Syntrophaceae bacterium]|nr:hypothetical protein [Syntrophaceae bacterium]